jgi:hypothetical protein
VRLGHGASEAIGAGWAAAPGRRRLCLGCRCVAAGTGGSNGLRPGQRPGGRRYSVPVSWGFPRLGCCCRGGPGARWRTRLRLAGHRAGARAARDCPSVRVCASEQCPRQDSNLRTRLRRGLLRTPLASGNMLLRVRPGGGPGTARRAWAAGCAWAQVMPVCVQARRPVCLDVVGRD